MARTPKKTPAELKAELKTAKAEAAAAKKEVAEAMKAYIDAPEPGSAKAYRNAVSDHVKAVAAQSKAENALA